MPSINLFGTSVPQHTHTHVMNINAASSPLAVQRRAATRAKRAKRPQWNMQRLIRCKRLMGRGRLRRGERKCFARPTNVESAVFPFSRRGPRVWADVRGIKKKKCCFGAAGRKYFTAVSCVIVKA